MTSEAFEERLELYFRSLGLEDGSVVRNTVAHLREQFLHHASRVEPSESFGEEISDTLSCIQVWLAQLVPSASASDTQAQDLLLWRLRGVLRAHPNLLSRSSNLVEIVREAIQAAQLSITPPEYPVAMPPQPPEKLSSVPNVSVWKQLNRRVARLWSAHPAGQVGE